MNPDPGERTEGSGPRESGPEGPEPRDPGRGGPEHGAPRHGDPLSEGTGLPRNVAGALSYLLGPITGVLFLVAEKRDPFVRFHAAQSIVFCVAWTAVWVGLSMLGSVLAIIPLIGWIISLPLLLLSGLLGLAGFLLWLFLMYQAWAGKEWEIPGIGPWSRRVLEGRLDG